MTDLSLEAIQREIGDLEIRLDQAAASEREELKRRIVAVFKRTDAVLADFGAARDRIKGLVDRFKQLAVSAEGEPVSVEPRPQIRADHLGASTYLEKAWSLIALGDHAGASQALARALELAPGDLQAQSLLGWAQMLDLRYDDALATLSKVLAAEPGNALARVNVGYICLKKRIFGEAIEHLSRAIRLDNDRKAKLYAHYYLGLVYLEREMFSDARNFLTQAIALGPNLIEAYYDLGRAQWFAGDRDAAKATWHKGANANRFAPWAARCRDLLENVERGGAVPKSASPA